MKVIKIKENIVFYVLEFTEERNYRGLNFICNNEGIDLILKILNLDILLKVRTMLLHRLSLSRMKSFKLLMVQGLMKIH